MNYYELIYLKQELKNKFIGCEIEQANTPYKNFMEFFVVSEQQKFRLQFSSAPANIALFMDTYRGAKKANTINFFGDIYGFQIQDIELAETDRWLSLVLQDNFRIRFRLFSNRSNVLLAKGDKIIEAFKDYDAAGQEVPKAKKLNLFEADIKEKSSRNKLISLNPMLPRQNLNDLIEIHNLKNKPDDEIVVFVKKITEALEAQATFRLLENGNTTLLPEQILPVSTIKNFESVNELIAYRYKNHSRDQRLHQKKDDLLKRIKKRIKRAKSALKNLEGAENGLERSQKFEKWGHLLMANAHLNHKEKTIEVDDLYKEGEKVNIPLPKTTGIAENAQYYYHKAQSAKKSYEEAVSRVPIIKKELQKHQELLAELEGITNLWDFQDWEKEKESELADYYSSDKKKESRNLPFFTFQIEGFPVWIGKNAKSNDMLVQKAHKEDIWMHARGVAGSHLVIRMGNEKTMPPKSVILKAASYAAYNSKARGSNLAPVIVTKMKYVRKPKGSAPGAVVVDKEEVEMVTPKKPD